MLYFTGVCRMDDLACSVAGSSLADDAEDELADLVR